jgi:hypothetical protein
VTAGSSISWNCSFLGETGIARTRSKCLKAARSLACSRESFIQRLTARIGFPEFIAKAIERLFRNLMAQCGQYMSLALHKDFPCRLKAGGASHSRRHVPQIPNRLTNQIKIGLVSAEGRTQQCVQLPIFSEGSHFREMLRDLTKVECTIGAFDLALATPQSFVRRGCAAALRRYQAENPTVRQGI